MEASDQLEFNIMLMEIVQDKKTDIDKQLLIEKRKEYHGRRHDETM